MRLTVPLRVLGAHLAEALSDAGWTPSPAGEWIHGDAPPARSETSVFVRVSAGLRSTALLRVTAEAVTLEITRRIAIGSERTAYELRGDGIGSVATVTTTGAPQQARTDLRTLADSAVRHETTALERFFDGMGG